jgi:putative endonuclease
MHFLYIIYSPAKDQYYTGEANNIPERMELHNSHKSVKSLTGAASDWQLKLIHKLNSRKKAVSLQKLIKKEDKEFIEKLIAQPELLKDLLKDLE